MSDKIIKVLLVEEDAEEARSIREMLDEEGSAPFEVLHAGRLSEASKSLGNGNFDVVLLSVSLPDSSGLGAVSKVHNAAPDVPLVVLCDPADEEFALDAVRNGAQEHLIRGQGDANLLKRSIRYAIERKQADRALQQFHVELQQTKQYMESLIESFADAIIAADCEGKVVRFNKGAEALAGYRREEVIGRQGPVLYESEEDAKEVIRRMREGGGTVSAFETTFRAKEGARIPVLISASILYDEEGQEVGAVGFSKDLRERKRAQEQLIRSEKMASVGLLTAGVSHEILNPLNVIILRLHTLIGNPDTPLEVTRYLRIMEKHANRITKITRDLLSFSRQREPKRRLIDLNESIKRTLSLLEHGLRIQNIEVESKLSDELPPGLADQDQLQQMVLNLLTNAKDAMPDGGHLSLTTKAVQTNGQMFIELRVEDTGEGIAPEDLENLFDPFFTTKDEGKGTGLGLSICQGIVEDYGGSIWAENVPDGGAAFVVRFGTEDE